MEYMESRMQDQMEGAQNTYEQMCQEISALQSRLLAAEAQSEALVKSGQAVVDRWDSPSWKDGPHTGVFINDLRKMIAATPSNLLEADRRLVRAECLRELAGQWRAIPDSSTTFRLLEWVEEFAIMAEEEADRIEAEAAQPAQEATKCQG